MPNPRENGSGSLTRAYDSANSLVSAGGRGDCLKFLENPLTILAFLCYNNMNFLLTVGTNAATVHQLRENFFGKVEYHDASRTSSRRTLSVRQSRAP